MNVLAGVHIPTNRSIYLSRMLFHEYQPHIITMNDTYLVISSFKLIHFLLNNVQVVHLTLRIKSVNVFHGTGAGALPMGAVVTVGVASIYI